MQRRARSDRDGAASNSHQDTTTTPGATCAATSIIDVPSSRFQTTGPCGPHRDAQGARGMPANDLPKPAPAPMVEADGIEPTTPCLQSRCSPTELRPLSAGEPALDLVGPGRFELPTSRLSSARSNQLSYEPGFWQIMKGIRRRRHASRKPKLPPGAESGTGCVPGSFTQDRVFPEVRHLREAAARTSLERR